MNAPLMFQHLMKTCFGNLQFQWFIIYLDDIIFAATPKEHLKRLHAVLLWLQVVRLKLQSAKCKFFQPSVIYLVHEIQGGHQNQGCKVKAIRNWPHPCYSYRITKLAGVQELLQAFHKGVCQGHLSLYDHISGGQHSP